MMSVVRRGCASVPRDSLHPDSAGPFGLQKLAANYKEDIIQHGAPCQHLLGVKFYQEASSSGISGCEDGPWILGKLHLVEEGRR